MPDSVPIDSPYHDAFGHWVFESAVFLPGIRSDGKNVMLSERRQYKTLFCKHIGFSDDNIEYGTVPRTSTLTLMDNPVPPEYPLLLQSFFTHFTSSVVPDVDFVLLPRQRKENYAVNDRPCKLTPYIDVFRASGRSYRVVNTDEITCLQTQIDLVNSGRTVIVTDGSPANVNGMFCSGKTIYVVRDGSLEVQVPQYPMLQVLHAEIRKKNNLQFIDGSQLFTLLSPPAADNQYKLQDTLRGLRGALHR
jgi:hypothetical protein